MGTKFKHFIKAKDVTFILTPDRIYVETKSCTFYLDPVKSYWKRRAMFIGTLIQLGEVNDLDTLSRYCSSNIKWAITPALKDCVYVVKKSGNNEELRYSLRSLNNLAHRQVVIIGHKPDWCTNVIHIPVNPYEHKWAKQNNRYHNTEMKWLYACLDERVSPNFYAMNDDFFIMKPVHGLPNYHRGTIAEHIAKDINNIMFNTHLRALEQTANFLESQKIYEALDYELHLPMVMNKIKRLAVHELIRPKLLRGQVILARSVYGNLFVDKFMKIDDCKNILTEDSPFTSTTDSTFRDEPIGEAIRQAFPEKSNYEI